MSSEITLSMLPMIIKNNSDIQATLSAVCEPIRKGAGDPQVDINFLMGKNKSLDQVFNRCRNVVSISCKSMDRFFAQDSHLKTVRRLYLENYPSQERPSPSSIRNLINNDDFKLQAGKICLQDKDKYEIVFELIKYLLSCLYQSIKVKSKKCEDIVIASAITSAPVPTHTASIVHGNSSKDDIKIIGDTKEDVIPFQSKRKYLKRVSLKKTLLNGPVVMVDDSRNAISNAREHIVHLSECSPCAFKIEGKNVLLTEIAKNLNKELTVRPFSLLSFHKKHNDLLSCVSRALNVSPKSRKCTATLEGFCEKVLYFVPDRIMSAERLAKLLSLTGPIGVGLPNFCVESSQLYTDQLRAVINDASVGAIEEGELLETLWNNDISTAFKDLLETKQHFITNLDSRFHYFNVSKHV